MKQLEDDLRALVTSYRINATVEVLAAPSSATTALALSSGNRTSLSKSRVSVDTKAASTLPKITEGVAASSAADGDAVVVAEKPPMKSSSDVDPFLSHSEHIGNAKALNSKQGNPPACIIIFFVFFFIYTHCPSRRRDSREECGRLHCVPHPAPCSRKCTRLSAGIARVPRVS
mmetsp:Transcript_21806/g.56641  ORF Transcript_21806/g.56641 Transcript_21806/m.56641 type:complete len:173 (-) Transcript_21806:535-1053(-)